MRPYPRLVLILFSALLAAVVWYAVALPRLAPMRDGVKYDPIEDDERSKPILAAVDREVEQIIADDPPELKAQLGYCHRVWGLKKHLLRENHGIEWRTPKEMNPRVAFD